MERRAAVTLNGNPLTLVGSELAPGQRLPEVTVLDTEGKPVTLSAYAGKIKVIASVPSLDTSVCDLEIKRFNKEAAGFSAGVVVLFVSMDLPFALRRFCAANDIRAVHPLSDHRAAEFGRAFGVLIKELRLLSRALFIADGNDILQYAEYVREMGSHPDYDAALAALRKVVTRAA